MQRLQDMERSDVAGMTSYACRSCGHSLVGVKTFKADAEARAASGYQLDRNVIGSKVDLHIHVAQESGESVMLIEATPAFFQ
jgi:nitrate/TMAO reductase-like tetraheme cytochrome c subunit